MIFNGLTKELFNSFRKYSLKDHKIQIEKINEYIFWINNDQLFDCGFILIKSK